MTNFIPAEVDRYVYWIEERERIRRVKEEDKQEDNTSGNSQGNEDKPENDKKEKSESMKGHLGGHNPDYVPEKVTPSNSDGSLSDEMFKEAMKSL